MKEINENELKDVTGGLTLSEITKKCEKKCSTAGPEVSFASAGVGGPNIGVCVSDCVRANRGWLTPC